MEQRELEQVVKNLSDRVTRVEQILPTLTTRDDLAMAVRPLATRGEMHDAIKTAVEPLATRAEMRAAIAAAVEPLATRAEMRAAIAAAVEPLATRAEMREDGERTRRHFDVVAERLETHIRLLAEGHGALREEMNAFRVEVKADIATLDRRVMRLEVSR